MKLFRFIGEEEFDALISGETIKPINDHRYSANSFEDFNKVYVIPYRDFEYIEEAAFDFAGVVYDDYVVVLEKPDNEVTHGYGRYAMGYTSEDVMPEGYISAEHFNPTGDPEYDVFDPDNPDVWIPEATIDSYSIEDVLTIYQYSNTGELIDITNKIFKEEISENMKNEKVVKPIDLFSVLSHHGLEVDDEDNVDLITMIITELTEYMEDNKIGLTVDPTYVVIEDDEEADNLFAYLEYILKEYGIKSEMIDEDDFEFDYDYTFNEAKEIDAKKVIKDWSNFTKGKHSGTFYSQGQLHIWYDKDDGFPELMKPYISEEMYNKLKELGAKATPGNNAQVSLTLPNAQRILKQKANITSEHYVENYKGVAQMIQRLEELEKDLNYWYELRDGLELDMYDSGLSPRDAELALDEMLENIDMLEAERDILHELLKPELEESSVAETTQVGDIGTVTSYVPKAKDKKRKKKKARKSKHIPTYDEVGVGEL